MNYCVNCKHCSINKIIEEYNQFGFFKKIFRCFDYEQDLRIHKSCPKCYHPDVYKAKVSNVRVFGNNKGEKLYCDTARTRSFTGDTYIYSCCGADGKYFEEYVKENKK